MKALIKFNFFIACVVITDGVDLLANEECEEDPQGYIVPDPIYCDRYFSPFIGCYFRVNHRIKYSASISFI